MTPAEEQDLAEFLDALADLLLAEERRAAAETQSAPEEVEAQP